MKKTLVAMAVLAAASAAQAQSNVTLYGLVDLWVGSLKTETLGVGDSVTRLDSGGFNSSRFGLQGSEDLGGGLKAVFKLEQGFRADTGVQSAAGTAFGRQSYLGLEGGFGGVYFGKVWTAMDDVVGASNPVFDSAFAPQSQIGVLYNTYAGNPGNSIKYVSPDFGGITFGATHSLDEVAGVSADITDFSLSYAGGPLAVNFAYQVQNGTPDDIKLTHLGATYDFGFVKAIAAYGNTKEGAARARDITIGADIPLSPALTLSAGYLTTDFNAAAGNGESSGFGISAKYSLSKRTFVYAGLVDVENEDAAGVKQLESRLYAVGLQHRF